MFITVLVSAFVVNTVFACGQVAGSAWTTKKEQEDILAKQIGFSVGAPIVALPYACKFALEVGICHTLLKNATRN